MFCDAICDIELHVFLYCEQLPADSEEIGVHC
jgi:hypothetical protein